jgi:hypothetical protein
MVQFCYLTCLKNHTLILSLFLYYWCLPVTYFTFTLLSEIFINFNKEQIVTVTLCVMASHRRESTNFGSLKTTTFGEIANLFKPKLPRGSPSLKQAQLAQLGVHQKFNVSRWYKFAAQPKPLKLQGHLWQQPDVWSTWLRLLTILLYVHSLQWVLNLILPKTCYCS